MAFRFYIVDSDTGIVNGTDDEAKAKEYSTAEYIYVIDTKQNTLFQVDGTRTAIEE